MLWGNLECNTQEIVRKFINGHPELSRPFHTVRAIEFVRRICSPPRISQVHSSVSRIVPKNRVGVVGSKIIGITWCLPSCAQNDNPLVFRGTFQNRFELPDVV